ncbi:hypothetical protein P7K49_014461 [Saguinus oedipus]|uniref:Uncharacterized protein n=1 Tax=Saguinus oedipus TaxID=9490 RepID=A0ABQ9VJH6_SAGOE|nr:hypothetical protein P7K49_014461 [Saguinus oedipus]
MECGSQGQDETGRLIQAVTSVAAVGAERRDPALWAGPRKWTLGGALGESQALQLPPAQGTRQQRRRPLSLPEPPVQRTSGPGAPWQLIRAVHCAAAGEQEPASAPCQPLFSAQCPPSLTGQSLSAEARSSRSHSGGCGVPVPAPDLLSEEMLA